MNQLHIYFRAAFVGCAMFMILAALSQTAWAQATIAEHINLEPVVAAIID